MLSGRARFELDGEDARRAGRHGRVPARPADAPLRASPRRTARPCSRWAASPDAYEVVGVGVALPRRSRTSTREEWEKGDRDHARRPRREARRRRHCSTTSPASRRTLGRSTTRPPSTCGRRSTPSPRCASGPRTTTDLDAAARPRRLAAVTVAVIADVHGNAWALDAVLADARAARRDDVPRPGRHARRPARPGRHRRPTDGARRAHRARQPRPDDGRGRRGRTRCCDRAPRLARDASRSSPSTRTSCCSTARRATTSTCLLERWTRTARTSAPLDEVAALLDGIDAPLILCGHTHTPRLVELPGGRRVLNPGSVGLQALPRARGRRRGRSAPAARTRATRCCTARTGAGGRSSACVAYPWASRGARRGRPAGRTGRSRSRPGGRAVRPRTPARAAGARRARRRPPTSCSRTTRGSPACGSPTTRRPGSIARGIELERVAADRLRRSTARGCTRLERARLRARALQPRRRCSRSTASMTRARLDDCRLTGLTWAAARSRT